MLIVSNLVRLTSVARYGYWNPVGDEVGVTTFLPDSHRRIYPSLQYLATPAPTDFVTSRPTPRHPRVAKTESLTSEKEG